jgi:hypothetical protein
VVNELAQKAGLKPPPKLIVERGDANPQATAKSPEYIEVHESFLKDPKIFRAVAAHELGHINIKTRSIDIRRNRMQGSFLMQLNTYSMLQATLLQVLPEATRKLINIMMQPWH